MKFNPECVTECISLVSKPPRKLGLWVLSLYDEYDHRRNERKAAEYSASLVNTRFAANQASENVDPDYVKWHGEIEAHNEVIYLGEKILRGETIVSGDLNRVRYFLQFWPDSLITFPLRAPFDTILEPHMDFLFANPKE